MKTRHQILTAAIGRGLAVGSAATVIALSGIGLASPASAVTLTSSPTRSVSTLDSCSNMGPDAKAESQYKSCGRTHAAHTYKSSKVVGKKRCYYFLTTQWNPCALPIQTDTSACKAL